MHRDLVRYNTEMYATKVMPEVSGLFEDEYEDHWWPQPLDERARRNVPEVPIS